MRFDPSVSVRHPRRWPLRLGVVSVVGATATSILLLLGTASVPVASAATTVNLGAAAPFAVLAGSAVTDVPTSAIHGDVGLSPAAGSNYSGLTQSQVTGTIYSTNASGPTGYVENPGLLQTAKSNLTTAFVSAQGQLPTQTFVTGDNQLGGKVLTPGVYAFGAAATANITAASPLVLNGSGVYIFQASSSLVTASGSVVELENGANACNVFWTVGSSATLGSGSTFVGTLMALTSATLDSTATVSGRILAQTAAVTLDANTITVPPVCATTTTTTTTTTPASTTTTTPGSTTTTAPGSTTTTAPGTTATTTPGTTTTTTPGTTTTTTPSGPGGAGGTAAGSTGSTGTTGAAGGTTGTAVVPLGFPHTGLGGAAHARDDDLIVLGALSLTGAAAAASLAVRRRKTRLAPVRTDGVA
jgi:hypothetical protein